MPRYIKLQDLMSKLGNFKYVENAPSRNGENKAPNQFIITYENGQVFQSYKSLCAAKVDGKLYLTRYHDYSCTTSLHVTKWTGLNTQDRRKGIADGRFITIEDYN